MRRFLVSCIVLTVFASAAYGQGATTVRVLRTAVILDDPRGDSLVVASAPPGVVLDVLARSGDWLQVDLGTAPGAKRPVGWIHRQLVEFLSSADASIPSFAPSGRSPSAVAAQPSVPERISPAAQRPLPRPGPQSETPRQTNTNRTPERSGFWFNVGLGYGSLGCDDCAGRADGFSGGLALGGTVSERVQLGVGTTGWARSVNGELLSVGTLDFRVRFYPVVTSGFFLNGGVGVGSISLDAGRLGKVTERGAGVMLGIGWDVPIGSHISLTPFWNGSAVRSSTADANFGQIGLGVTFH